MSRFDKESFALHKDAIDPSSVPFKILPSGAKLPVVGLGTFGSDHISGEQVAASVKDAIARGYRHIDCAAVYGNEKAIGRVLKEVLDSGLIKREELWITSKLWNDMHSPEDVEAACRRSIADLGLDYLDLYLVHWPFPNYHPPNCNVDSRSPDAKPYIHENFMKTWKEMERLQRTGLCRHIGTSNMTIPKLKLILRDAEIKPVCNEMELHPHFQQPEFVKFVLDHGIIPIGFCPIGSPGRPERDRTPEDSVDIEDPIIRAIAEDHNVHPATICIKWAVQNGQIPIPFSTNPQNYMNNLLSAVKDPLTEDEMEKIAGIDKNCRLIKGQVFLWKDNQSWHDLWDEEGIIAD
ncbi:MAG: aldo/keto reductase [Spirochaetales bacterium]|uniref:Aldo/keto reductase n=1 Tax=Candidatus Thalassospirochaeta sargassi TaxID=3119039 RepID=A0AAJ1IGB3_9SPIO|nr:aldo/keto reductase [Spirochaetales bacterium]